MKNPLERSSSKYQVHLREITAQMPRPRTRSKGRDPGLAYFQGARGHPTARHSCQAEEGSVDDFRPLPWTSCDSSRPWAGLSVQCSRDS